jgi:N-acetylmuramoyl-L-alanine amidase
LQTGWFRDIFRANKEGGLLLTRLFCLWLGLAVVTGAGAQSRPLKSSRLGGISFVSARDLADYYSLGNDSSTAPDRAEYRTAYAQLIISDDGREITLNGVQHWLSVPVRSDREQLWIAAIDVLKTIDPVLRQGRTAQKTSVRTIVLDPGHGGSDRGTRGESSREKDLTLDVARRVQRLLEAAGFKVIPTRTTDETVSLEDRVDLATRKQADLYVSIHFNSGGSAEGVETYCVPPAGAPTTASPFRRLFGIDDDDACSGNKTDEKNVWLAHCVQRAVLRATGANDRGVRRARFYVLRNATCPAILIEGGFLTNRAEEQRLLTADYRDKLAKAIAEGIVNYRKSNE